MAMRIRTSFVSSISRVMKETQRAIDPPLPTPFHSGSVAGRGVCVGLRRAFAAHSPDRSFWTRFELGEGNRHRDLGAGIWAQVSAKSDDVRP